MSATREAVNEAYKAAMKAKDEISVRTLRLLNADVKKIEVDERRTVTEEEVRQLLQRSIKKRRETIEAAQGQGRSDVADAEAAEVAVLQKFLPKQMSEAELVALIDSILAETGAKTKKEQGKVMSALMPKLEGRADGKLVAKLVSERLV